MNICRIKIVVVLFLLTAVTFTAPAGAGQNYRPDHIPSVSVATYNAYIGTDVFAVLGGAKSLQDAIAEIVALNFPERAEAIVRALIKPSPDLIGFQEAWHIQINTPQLQLDWNYREILAGLLDRYGYREVVSSDLSDLLIPLDNSDDYVRVTDHDVIFAKKCIQATDSETLLYSSTFKASFADQTIVSKRGLVSAVFGIGGREYRFVDTHLETQGLPAVSAAGDYLGIAQDLQAQELVAHLADETRPVILVGDFNATGGSQPIIAIENGGFIDMWSLRLHDRRDPGYTCCQAPDLLNVRSILDQRIDHIFVRNDSGEFPCSAALPLVIDVIGNRIADKTRTRPRLWPSDHAGVRSALVIPPLNDVD